MRITLSSLVVASLALVLSRSADGGFTLYFHGANLGTNPTATFLRPMGESTVEESAAITDFWELRQSFVRGGFSHQLTLLSGDPETAVEHVVLGNWQNHSGGQVSGTRVAEAFANYLLAERPSWLSGPIDAIGHSRGGGVIYDFAKTLGRQNIGVEGLHFLDNHPVNGVPPQSNALLDWGDSIPTHLENVGFAINYFQRNDSLIPGKTVEGALNVDISDSRLDHFGVYSYFHGTINVEADRVVPRERFVRDGWYEGGNGPRSSMGFQLTHLGRSIHERQLEGVHPALGGTGDVSPIEGLVSDGAWPWIDLTHNTRASLADGGGATIEFAYSDPDSPVTLVVLIGTDSNPDNASQIHTTALPATSDRVLETLDLVIPNDSPTTGFLHFLLNDGTNIKYTSAAFRAIPEPSSILVLVFTLLSFCLVQDWQRWRR